ncbi:hypothetical protein BC831DRAFT_472975 [Entophlyctis helioformis]|nr:hypothetical protein BC831DRAFT_472975 [Entophlyctis helioformis]
MPSSTQPDPALTAAALARWRSRLASLTELILPTDYPRPVPPRLVEAEQAADLSDAAALAILQLSLALKVSSAAGSPTASPTASSAASPFTILLAAFAVLLQRHTGEEDIAIGSSSSSSNPLVLRIAIKPSDSMAQVIDTVCRCEAEALADEVPFAALVDAMAAASASAHASAHASAIDTASASASAIGGVSDATAAAAAAAAAQPSLFKVRFFNQTDTTADTLASSSSTSSSSDMTIFISQAPTLRRLLPIQIKIVYNSTLFSASRISDMVDQLQLLLESAAANIATPVGQISLVTARSKALLPDPCANLNWDGFEGAITDIFAANARRHPDRVCVVEHVPVDPLVCPFVPSADPADAAALAASQPVERVFTYQQINQASNILAHHLINSGIKPEDVVVLYSYRGVDLVVAIMGVLKAGATFSVIDPAYPPPRQNVYLSVAQPRALVILARAGALHDEVREYVRDKLSIICEVPALEISNDGSLRGGVLPGGKEVDVLAAATPLAGQDPAIVLGPDSVGTLSFTSGSTGTPKGVRGRHFSLTHFYPWMKQEFALTDNEHFTMLSGIAHDPIQRDIFTPLFLGARLCIPTANDIGSPGRLAEWMARQGITITHLTPAMGQLLSANATHPIPTLRHAFFVGDVLTKRDVLRLQHLAPNVHVINMYGTTETQRAVSFLKIPPIAINPAFLTEQKDIMPAGKGMKDVQLLVVNQNNLLCGVGEVGEIYVRSSGLAEGYLALPDVTSTKFIANPFNPAGPPITEAGKQLSHYLGPRDRMYRTGDLGRYKPDGSVECTGRADDQVKIRGFRIELGEIDTHLSQHPSVRENVTLVRRDKYEEQTLVSYFVPFDYESLENAAETIKDIRSYLKQKLPSYAVPTVFVPLMRMPLTPNGKVDKNALPFPDTALAAAVPGDTAAGANAEEGSNLSSQQRSLRGIWSDLLGVPPSTIGLEDNFFDLGGHSILATRLIFAIRTAMAVDAPLGMVYQSPTLVGMAREIDFLRGGDLGLMGNAVSASDSNDALEPSARPRRTKSTEHMLPPSSEPAFDYAADLDVVDDPSLAAGTLSKFDYSRFSTGSKVTFFLTGVTGFLGAFILASLLRRFPGSRVICLVRASSSKDGLARVVANGERHLVWDAAWLDAGRVEVVVGDLGAESFGVDEATWAQLVDQVDVIVHNGALVHWVYPYHKLRAANVIGTKTALRLATTHHLKPLHFVSSTSVLDTEHYARKHDVGASIYESDDLEGSRLGLRSGYGQTKWVAEKLVMRAQERGVPATIIRPGYIVGDSRSGVTNTDDFLWRLVKGCIQLGKVPRIGNVVNMCSVDYVADTISEVVSAPASLDLRVFHMWNPHRFRFDDMFSSLLDQKYSLEKTEYVQWRTALMDLTLSTADNALYPLLHFVLDDLPTSTKSAELDDENTLAIIRNSAVRCTNMSQLMPLYLGYLAAVGFIEAPAGSNLPSLSVWDKVRGQIVARSGN